VTRGQDRSNTEVAITQPLIAQFR